MTSVQKKDLFLIGILLAITGFFFFNDFLTAPRVAWDEGLNLNLAKNLAEFGKWQVQESPGQFSGQTHFYSTGWTILFPSAVIFKIFGVSFMAGRLMMFAYLTGFLILSFFLGKMWFGRSAAFLGVLLIAVFTPVYTYGKPLLGEIPSLFWLVLGILLFEKLKQKWQWQHAALTGFCFGAAAASKLTYVILFSPVVAIMALTYFARKKVSLIWLLFFTLSFFVAIAPVLWFSFSFAVLNSSFGEVISFYSNNHASSCLSCDVKNNFIKFFTSKSLLYTGVLMMIAILGALKIFIKNKTLHYAVWGAGLYGLLTLTYFFKSPGVVRYLLPIQIIVIFVAPFLIIRLADNLSEVIKNKIFLKRLGWALIALLVLFNLYSIIISGYATSSSAPVEMEKYVKNYLPKEGMVGVINLPALAAVIPSHRLINYIRIDNQTDRAVGINPLAFNKEEMPEFLIFDESNGKTEKDLRPFNDKLENLYAKIFEAEKYKIFQLK
ncbi:hypothetical protein C4572_00995 [Candidatus Parcubacteria bacterium]|nr:MAG: hypothetical protein C4572_00995 [Candidatus Parcubacteria bacterium]